MIRHTVAFRLKHPAHSVEEKNFMAEAGKLRVIPGIESFEVLAQVSAKNDFKFGLSMEFANQAAYQAYNDHPQHVAFVRDRWVPEVVAFMELDYTVLD
jgi:heme-degrading monooxygenase HmoA